MTHHWSILSKNSSREVSLLLLFMGTTLVFNENSVYGRRDILIWIAIQTIFDSFVYKKKLITVYYFRLSIHSFQTILQCFLWEEKKSLTNLHFFS